MPRFIQDTKRHKPPVGVLRQGESVTVKTDFLKLFYFTAFRDLYDCMFFIDIVFFTVDLNIF